MKTRYVLPFAVLGILLVALFALSSCNNGEPSDGSPTPNETPVVDGPSGEFSEQVGGPYSFAIPGKKGEEKIEEFSCYKEMGLSFSKAVQLKDVLLEDSIRENSDFNPEYSTQKYNYVIDMGGNIMVAQWTSGASLDDLDQKVSNGKLIEKCQDKYCKDGSGRRDFPLKDIEVLVNWYPEDKDASPRQSPCWLDGNREDGLLDAISKHFMIAQGEGRTIDDFDRNRWYQWTAKELLYAGEFIVDADREGGCISDVNGDSGTYRPKTSYQTLKKVWDYFGKQLPGKVCQDTQ